MLHNVSRWLSRHRKAAIVIMAAVLVSVPLAASAASNTESTGIPPATISQLTAKALTLATRGGDANPGSMEAVATTRDKGLSVATPGDTVPGSASQNVYLVVIEGNFTLNDAPRPPKAPAPSGNYLAITLNTATLQVMDLGLSNQDPSASLGSLGVVYPLVKQK